MSKYTKGPWKVDNHQDANHCVINPQVGNWVAVLQLNGEQSVTVQEANAALIAAAPDLLAACEFALRFYQDNFENFPIAYQSVVDFMESAIRKAEGGQE